MRHKTYLALAIPLIISTLTTPLLGAVDTAVVGQLANPAYIAAVAAGTVIFNTLYWLFGFLRVSTSGFAAQANGASDKDEMMLAIMRPFLMAAFIGILFIALQSFIGQLFLPVLSSDSAVLSLATEYFQIRIYGAPFALLNYVILGWLMGMSKIRVSMFLQISTNLLNIVLNILFVYGFSMNVDGVALATLLAEITSFIIGLVLLRRALPVKFQLPALSVLLNKQAMGKIMSVNRDLFIRTVCLLAVFNSFTAIGASYGTEIVAANAILIQIQYLMVYIYDGFANASSILTGQAIGRRDQTLYKRVVNLSCQWSIYASLMIALVYFFWSGPIIQLFTNSEKIIGLAQAYGMWLLLFPLVSSFGVILYGVFTGAAHVAPVRNSMILSLLLYILILSPLTPWQGNHCLWFAFIAFSAGRSLFLWMYVPNLGKKLFHETEKHENTVIG